MSFQLCFSAKNRSRREYPFPLIYFGITNKPQKSSHPKTRQFQLPLSLFPYETKPSTTQKTHLKNFPGYSPTLFLPLFSLPKHPEINGAGVGSARLRRGGRGGNAPPADPPRPRPSPQGPHLRHQSPPQTLPLSGPVLPLLAPRHLLEVRDKAFV